MVAGRGKLDGVGPDRGDDGLVAEQRQCLLEEDPDRRLVLEDEDAGDRRDAVWPGALVGRDGRVELVRLGASAAATGPSAGRSRRMASSSPTSRRVRVASSTSRSALRCSSSGRAGSRRMTWLKPMIAASALLRSCSRPAAIVSGPAVASLPSVALFGSRTSLS